MAPEAKYCLEHHSFRGATACLKSMQTLDVSPDCQDYVWVNWLRHRDAQDREKLEQKSAVGDSFILLESGHGKDHISSCPLPAEGRFEDDIFTDVQQAGIHAYDSTLHISLKTEQTLY